MITISNEQYDLFVAANGKLAKIDFLLYELRTRVDEAPQHFKDQQIERINSLLADGKTQHHRAS